MDFENYLNLGVQKNIITNTQKEELLKLLKNPNTEEKQVTGIVKIFYYIGGFIMFCAMSALMSHTIQHSTYTMILSLGSLYAVIFLAGGEFLWRKQEKLPAGILYFIFICAISFIIMDIEKMTGFFPHFSDMDKYPNYFELCCMPIIVLSIITIISNSILQKFSPHSLLAIPTIVSSYAIYMCILDRIFGKIIWEKAFVEFAFFSILTIIAFIKDRLAKADYSKWMYFIGAIGIFNEVISCSYNHFNSEIIIIENIVFITSLLYCLIGILIERKPFTVIGILGVINYIIYLEFHFIKNNTILLTSVTLITGLIILYVGFLYNKNQNKIKDYIIGLLPEKISKYLPQNRI